MNWPKWDFNGNKLSLLLCVAEKRHSHVHLHTPLKPLGPSSSHSHHHTKKDKEKKGHKKKKHEGAGKKKLSPEKLKGYAVEREKAKEISTTTEAQGIPEEKLETNTAIVDQTISILPNIDEHEILSTPATPPIHSMLSEEPDPSIIDSAKETKLGRHRHKHNEQTDSNDTPVGKGGHHHR